MPLVIHSLINAARFRKLNWRKLALKKLASAQGSCCQKVSNTSSCGCLNGFRKRVRVEPHMRMTQKTDIQKIPDRDENNSLLGPRNIEDFYKGMKIWEIFFKIFSYCWDAFDSPVRGFLKDYFELFNLFCFGFIQCSKHPLNANQGAS